MTQRLATEAFQRPETYEALRRSLDDASTLIPDAYTAPEFHKLEQEHVFAQGWVAVGCTSEFTESGEVKLRRVGGRSMLIVRDKSGTLRAFHNVCRHRGTQLITEDGKHQRIRCRYHGWTYGLDGRCQGAPFFEKSRNPDTTPTFCKEDFSLFPVVLEVWGFVVFVNLSDSPQPLSEWLGDLPERLAGHPLEQFEVNAQKDYEVNANHKLCAENFMEYYHLPTVHPELSEVSRVEDHHRWQGPGAYTGMVTRPVSRDRNSVWVNLPEAPGLSEEHRDASDHIWIFPNVAITLLPNHAFCLINEPLAAKQTCEHTYLLTPAGSQETEPYQEWFEVLAEFWNMVNLQDVGIIEQVHAGLEHPAFTGGRMCFRFEEPLHRYQNWIADRMLGLDRIPPGD